jgi:hypothetical protein
VPGSGSVDSTCVSNPSQARRDRQIAPDFPDVANVNQGDCLGPGLQQENLRPGALSKSLGHCPRLLPHLRS